MSKELKIGLIAGVALLLFCLGFISHPVSRSGTVGGFGDALSTAATGGIQSVTSGNTMVLAANPARLFARLQNTGGDQVYCSFNKAAVVKQGIWLPATSVATFLILPENLHVGQLNCIASTSSSISFVEY